MFRFQHPEFFLLLALVPVALFLFVFAYRQKRKTAARIADPGLLQFLLRNYSSGLYKLKFVFLAIALGLLALAAVNPRKASSFIKVSRNGVDVMIVLDVSKSMLAQDIRPSRLERAKQFCAKLIDKLNNDRVGIVVFAGRAYLQMPLTSDPVAAKMYINTADPGQIPTQGTVISSALQMAASGFNQQEKKYKTILLISDGEDHDEEAVKTARELANQGIIINTIGIGSPQGSIIPDENTGQPKTDKDGNLVISKLNEKELQTIAAAANGNYLLFENTDTAVEAIGSDISRMDQRPVTDDSLTNFFSFAVYLLAAALLLLLVEFFMRENRQSVKRRTFKISTGVIIFLFSHLHVLGQPAKEWVRKGNEAYEKKDFATASRYFQKALDINPNMAVAAFNKGNADYRAKRTDDAVASYDAAANRMKDPVQKSNSYFNKGVVFQNNNMLPECIDAYKDALILDPHNEDARQNLQKALQEQQRQQEEQDRKKEQQKNKNQTPPKPKPSQMKKQEALDKLKALEQQEKDLQDKLHKANPASISRPEKDW